MKIKKDFIFYSYKFLRNFDEIREIDNCLRKIIARAQEARVDA
jgi:hypothetical protein